MIASLALRNVHEIMLRTLGIAERQQKGYAFIGEHGFDIGELPILDMKAYSGERDPDDFDLAMMHCTAVTSGFGVQKYGPTGTVFARKLLVSGAAERTAPLLYAQMRAADMFSDFDAAVHFLALALRFRNTPYHVIGTQAGYLFKNRRKEQSSHHGQGTRTSGGNRGMGVAFDASPTTKLTDWLIATFRGAVRLAHLWWLEDQTEADPLWKVVCHAQAKYPGRAKDPGPELWRRVVVPEVTALQSEGHGVVIDLKWKYGTGRKPDWMVAA
jgi:hypothetical protein